MDPADRMMKEIASGMRLIGLKAIQLEILERAGTPVNADSLPDRAVIEEYRVLHEIITRALRRTLPDYDIQALLSDVKARRKAKERRPEVNKPS